MNWNSVKSNAASLLTNQAGLLVSFRWNGAPYQGVKSTLRRQDVNSSQGLAESYVFSLLCPLEQFRGQTPKARKDKIQIASETFRILDTETDAAGAIIRLNLGAITQ